MERYLQTAETINESNHIFYSELIILSKICSAIAEMSRINIVHCAICPQNILIIDKNNIKIINLGEAEEVTEKYNFSSFSRTK